MLDGGSTSGFIVVRRKRVAATEDSCFTHQTCVADQSTTTHLEIKTVPSPSASLCANEPPLHNPATLSASKVMPDSVFLVIRKDHAGLSNK